MSSGLCTRSYVNGKCPGSALNEPSSENCSGLNLEKSSCFPDTFQNSQLEFNATRGKSRQTKSARAGDVIQLEKSGRGRTLENVLKTLLKILKIAWEDQLGRVCGLISLPWPTRTLSTGSRLLILYKTQNVFPAFPYHASLLQQGIYHSWPTKHKTLHTEGENHVKCVGYIFIRKEYFFAAPKCLWPRIHSYQGTGWQ